MQPLLLNVDWLAVSIHFHSQEWGQLAAGHFFVECDGTNVWRHRRIVFNEYSEKVATILWCPKSKVIAANCGQIEIANEWLYHGQHPYRILDLLSNWRHFAISGISRVDLCVDFNPTARQLHHIFALAKGADYVAAKQSRVPWFGYVRSPLLSTRYAGKEIPYDQSWGHKTTAVKWKLYYKSKELVDAMGGKLFAKPYILDCWEDAGLDRSDVWRLEVSIKQGNSLEFRQNPITLDQVRKHPEAIFKALYTRRFIVRRSEGHKDRTNDRLVDFLPIGRASGLKTATAASERQRNPAITLLRHQLDAIEQPEILSNDELRELSLANIAALVDAGNLGNYFRAITGESISDYSEGCRMRARTLKETGEVIGRKPLSEIMADQAKVLWTTEEQG